MTLTISVAMCTFNGERFVGEQVDSILAQTRLPDEIVVSDDGSSDQTVALIRSAVGAFTRANPDVTIRLRVILNPTALGVTRNFEQAITATTSDVIVLCDQDDRWQPERIERALAEFERRPDLLLVFGNARLVDDQGTPLRYSLFDAIGLTAHEREQIAAGDGLAPLLGRNVVTGATTAFRRQLLRAAVPFPDGWVHDEWLAAIAAATGAIDLLDLQLVDYRQHGTNVIGASKITVAARFRKLREPREARNQQLLDRAAALLGRLAELGELVSADDVLLAEAKLDHERVRRALPQHSFARLRPVMRELRVGGYRRYGRGLQDALRDLVQPAR